MANLRVQADMSDAIPLPAAEETRRCVECGEVKPIDAFHLAGKKGRRHCCPPCLSARRAANGEHRTPENRRREKLRDKYGITVEQYDLMLAAQQGRCAICDKPPTKRALAVDHCHATGVVRALLCSPCNTSLGGYEAVRDSAPAYLALYGAGNPLLSND